MQAIFRPNRRRLLQAGGAALAAFSLPFAAVRDAQAALNGRTLFAIHLGGGNDSLNTVVPYTSSAYYSARGALAIAASSVLKLSTTQGLHPALPTLAAEYAAGRLAVINGVGYPNFDYSHFEATQIYSGADPSRLAQTGWLGRALESADASPDLLAGLRLGGDNARALDAESYIAPVLPNTASDFKLSAANSSQRSALTSLLQAGSSDNPTLAAVLAGNVTALGALDAVAAAGTIATTGSYPSDGFGSSLRLAAQMLASDPGIAVMTLRQSGYDTHTDQLASHAALLTTLDAGLTAFMHDVTALGLKDRVAILLWSEFGRRVAANSSAGTDHGAAQAMLLLGHPVRGAILGSTPKLDSASLVDDGNEAMQTDFRSVFASLLAWLGVDDNAVLGASWSRLSLFR